MHPDEPGGGRLKFVWALGGQGCSLSVHSSLFLLAPGEDEEMADLMEDVGIRSVSNSCCWRAGALRPKPWASQLLTVSPLPHTHLPCFLTAQWSLGVAHARQPRACNVTADPSVGCGESLAPSETPSASFGVGCIVQLKEERDGPLSLHRGHVLCRQQGRQPACMLPGAGSTWGRGTHH